MAQAQWCAVFELNLRHVHIARLQIAAIVALMAQSGCHVLAQLCYIKICTGAALGHVLIQHYHLLAIAVNVLPHHIACLVGQIPAHVLNLRIQIAAEIIGVAERCAQEQNCVA